MQKKTICGTILAAGTALYAWAHQASVDLALVPAPRAFAAGDGITIDFPMDIRCVKGRKRQSGRFAVMRGPLLYALDTRRIEGFEKTHPLDAAAVVMLDPAQLEFRAGSDGGRAGFCGTAIATRCANVDWARWIKPTDPEILLTEFADEEDTLAYFRTPDPDSPLLVDDELFGKTRRCH